MGAEVKLDPTPGKAGTSRRRHEQKREQASNTCNHLGWTHLAQTLRGHLKSGEKSNMCSNQRWVSLAQGHTTKAQFCFFKIFHFQRVASSLYSSTFWKSHISWLFY